MVLKQHRCKGCTSNIMKESETSDDDKGDKFKLHKQEITVSKSNINELYAGKYITKTGGEGSHDSPLVILQVFHKS